MRVDIISIFPDYFAPLELSLIDYFPEKNAEGHNRGIGNPVDLMVGLTTSVAFDRLYLATLGRQVKPMNKP